MSDTETIEDAPAEIPSWYDKLIAEKAKEGGKQGELDEGQLRILLDAAVCAIEQHPQENARIRSIIADLERYTGQVVTATSAPDLAVYERIEETAALKYNVCYSVVSTIVSRICSFRPRAQFVPEYGNYKTHRLARDLTSGSDAWAQREQYQREASLAFRDCLTSPGGVLKVYDQDDSPHLMRVPPWELKIHPEDDRNGDPECQYHVRWITQSQALQTYGINATARMEIITGSTRLANTTGYGAMGMRNGVAMTRVIDAYKRASGEDMGRHVLMVGDYIARNREYKHERLPFEIFVFDESPSGSSWGSSAIGPIRSIQDRVDDTLATIDEAHHLAAKLVIAMEEGSVAPENLTNDAVLSITHPPGKPPTFMNPRAVDPGSYQWWQIIKAMAFEILGVSPNAAQATKPAAVTAAVAIEAVTDLQSDRLSQMSQQWEQMCPRVAELWYAVSVDCGAGGGEYLAVDRGASRVVKFTKMSRKPSIRVFPTSLFGQSIPARLQKGMDAVKAGWFSEEEIMYILNIPDLGPATELKLAEFFYIEKLVDDVLWDGKYETPDVWANPIKVFDYSRKRYLQAITEGGFPKEHLTDMRKLLDYIQPIADKARAKASGAPAPQLAAPAMAAPAAAPMLPGLLPTPEASPLAMPQAPMAA